MQLKKTETARAVINNLQKLGTSARAKASLWFFKTKKGQYGHGDVFFGVGGSTQRKIAKEYHTLPLKELSKLLTHKVHECRQTALFILVLQYKKANDAERSRIVRFYLAHRKGVSNWDLVDCSVPHILGDYLLHHDRSLLYTFARSKNIWERRIAIIATFAFIRAQQYGDTLKIAKLLLHDHHDLIHKAVGWMLREVGKRSLITEEKFLKKYAIVMPRTMLRYAIEKFPEKKRMVYLSMTCTSPQQYL